MPVKESQASIKLLELNNKLHQAMADINAGKVVEEDIANVPVGPIKAAYDAGAEAIEILNKVKPSSEYMMSISALATVLDKVLSTYPATEDTVNMPTEVAYDLTTEIINHLAALVHDSAMGIIGVTQQLSACAVGELLSDEAGAVSKYCSGVLPAIAKATVTKVKPSKMEIGGKTVQIKHQQLIIHKLGLHKVEVSPLTLDGQASLGIKYDESGPGYADSKDRMKGVQDRLTKLGFDCKPEYPSLFCFGEIDKVKLTQLATFFSLLLNGDVSGLGNDTVGVVSNKVWDRSGKLYQQYGDDVWQSGQGQLDWHTAHHEWLQDKETYEKEAVYKDLRELVILRDIHHYLIEEAYHIEAIHAPSFVVHDPEGIKKVILNGKKAVGILKKNHWEHSGVENSVAGLEHALNQGETHLMSNVDNIGHSLHMTVAHLLKKEGTYGGCPMTDDIGNINGANLTYCEGILKGTSAVIDKSGNMIHHKIAPNTYVAFIMDENPDGSYHVTLTLPGPEEWQAPLKKALKNKYGFTCHGSQCTKHIKDLDDIRELALFFSNLRAANEIIGEECIPKAFDEAATAARLNNEKGVFAFTQEPIMANPKAWINLCHKKYNILPPGLTEAEKIILELIGPDKVYAGCMFQESDIVPNEGILSYCGGVRKNKVALRNAVFTQDGALDHFFHTHPGALDKIATVNILPIGEGKYQVALTDIEMRGDLLQSATINKLKSFGFKCPNKNECSVDVMSNATITELAMFLSSLHHAYSLPPECTKAAVEHVMEEVGNLPHDKSAYEHEVSPFTTDEWFKEVCSKVSETGKPPTGEAPQPPAGVKGPPLMFQGWKLGQPIPPKAPFQIAGCTSVTKTKPTLVKYRYCQGVVGREAHGGVVSDLQFKGLLKGTAASLGFNENIHHLGAQGILFDSKWHDLYITLPDNLAKIKPVVDALQNDPFSLKTKDSKTFSGFMVGSQARRIATFLSSISNIEDLSVSCHEAAVNFAIIKAKGTPLEYLYPYLPGDWNKEVCHPAKEAQKSELEELILGLLAAEPTDTYTSSEILTFVNKKGFTSIVKHELVTILQKLSDKGAIEFISPNIYKHIQPKEKPELSEGGLKLEITGWMKSHPGLTFTSDAMPEIIEHLGFAKPSDVETVNALSDLFSEKVLEYTPPHDYVYKEAKEAVELEKEEQVKDFILTWLKEHPGITTSGEMEAILKDIGYPPSVCNNAWLYMQKLYHEGKIDFTPPHDYIYKKPTEEPPAFVGWEEPFEKFKAENFEWTVPKAQAQKMLQEGMDKEEIALLLATKSVGGYGSLSETAATAFVESLVTEAVTFKWKPPFKTYSFKGYDLHVPAEHILELLLQGKSKEEIVNLLNTVKVGKYGIIPGKAATEVVEHYMTTGETQYFQNLDVAHYSPIIDDINKMVEQEETVDAIVSAISKKYNLWVNDELYDQVKNQMEGKGKKGEPGKPAVSPEQTESAIIGLLQLPTLLEDFSEKAIADWMTGNFNVSEADVSVALQKLADAGGIELEEGGGWKLTGKPPLEEKTGLSPEELKAHVVTILSHAPDKHAEFNSILNSIQEYYSVEYEEVSKALGSLIQDDKIVYLGGGVYGIGTGKEALNFDGIKAFILNYLQDNPGMSVSPTGFVEAIKYAGFPLPMLEDIGAALSHLIKEGSVKEISTNMFKATKIKEKPGIDELIKQAEHNVGETHKLITTEIHNKAVETKEYKKLPKAYKDYLHAMMNFKLLQGHKQGISYQQTLEEIQESIKDWYKIPITPKMIKLQLDIEKKKKIRKGELPLEPGKKLAKYYEKLESHEKGEVYDYIVDLAKEGYTQNLVAIKVNEEWGIAYSEELSKEIAGIYAQAPKEGEEKEEMPPLISMLSEGDQDTINTFIQMKYDLGATVEETAAGIFEDFPSLGYGDLLKYVNKKMGKEEEGVTKVTDLAEADQNIIKSAIEIGFGQGTSAEEMTVAAKGEYPQLDKGELLSYIINEYGFLSVSKAVEKQKKAPFATIKVIVWEEFKKHPGLYIKRGDLVAAVVGKGFSVPTKKDMNKAIHELEVEGVIIQTFEGEPPTWQLNVVEGEEEKPIMPKDELKVWLGNYLADHPGVEFIAVELHQILEQLPNYSSPGIIPVGEALDELSESGTIGKGTTTPFDYYYPPMPTEEKKEPLVTDVVEAIKIIKTGLDYAGCHPIKKGIVLTTPLTTYCQGILTPKGKKIAGFVDLKDGNPVISQYGDGYRVDVASKDEGMEHIIGLLMEDVEKTGKQWKKRQESVAKTLVKDLGYTCDFLDSKVTCSRTGSSGQKLNQQDKEVIRTTAIFMSKLHGIDELEAGCVDEAVRRAMVDAKVVEVLQKPWVDAKPFPYTKEEWDEHVCSKLEVKPVRISAKDLATQLGTTGLLKEAFKMGINTSGSNEILAKKILEAGYLGKTEE